MTDKLVTREGRFFTHQELWFDLQGILRLLETEPHPRGLYSAAIVLTYACLEAYVNYLGEELFPDTWTIDKRSGRKKGLGGTLAKLALLHERLGLPLDRSNARYSTLRQLKSRRDDFAHPRIETRSHRVTLDQANRMRPIQSQYDRLLTTTFVNRAVRAITDTATALQQAAHEQFPGKILSPKPFSGILGMTGFAVDP